MPPVSRAERSALPAPIFFALICGCVVALGAGSSGCDGGDPGGSRDVRVLVEHIGLDAHDAPVLLLGEQDGNRWLPIWIGDPEARAIARTIGAIESPRPDTHDLARRMIDGLRGELERVVVTELRAGTYYATITLRAAGRRVEIDARPSDAIAIALRAGSPIYVREPLLVREPLASGEDEESGAAI